MNRKISIVDYALQYQATTDDISHFLKYLQQYPKLGNKGSDQWNTIQFFITELADSPKVTIAHFKHQFIALTDLYVLLAMEQKESYLKNKKTQQFTANLIFKLSTCFTKLKNSTISAKAINQLLDLLAEQEDEITAFSICNTMRGVGYLAGRQFLSGKVKSGNINKLLAALVHKQNNATSEALAFIFEAIGLMSLSDHLKYKIDAHPLGELLEIMIARNVAFDELGLSLTHVQNVANQNGFYNGVAASVMTQCLHYYYENKADESQSIHVLNTIMALSEYDFLDGQLDHKTFNDIMMFMLSASLDAQIVDVFQKMPTLVIHNHLSGKIETILVNNFLSHVIRFANDLKPAQLFDTFLAASHLATSADSAGNILQLCNVVAQRKDPANTLSGLYGLMRCNARRFVCVSLDKEARLCFQTMLTSLDDFVLEKGDEVLTSEQVQLMATCHWFYSIQYGEEFAANKVSRRCIAKEFEKYQPSKIKKSVAHLIDKEKHADIHCEAHYRMGGYVIDCALHFRDVNVAVHVLDPNQAIFDPKLREFLMEGDNWIPIEITVDEWKWRSNYERKSLIVERVLSLIPQPKVEVPQPDVEVVVEKTEPGKTIKTVQKPAVENNTARKRKTQSAPRSKKRVVEQKNSQRFFDEKPKQIARSKKDERCCCSKVTSYISGMIFGRP